MSAAPDASYRIAPEGVLVMPYGADSLVVTRDGHCTAVAEAARDVMLAVGAGGASLAQLAASVVARVPYRDGFVAGMESVRRLIQSGAMVPRPSAESHAGPVRSLAGDIWGDKDAHRASTSSETGRVQVTELGLPWTTFAAAAGTTAALITEVLASPGRRLLEFGPGLSTVAVAKAAGFVGVKVQLFGIEQNGNWAAAVTAALPLVAQVAGSIVVAPLVPTASRDRGPFPVARWYDPAALVTITGPFDVVLVDSPTAFRSEWKYDRWPAFDFVRPMLAAGAALVLDDANRAGEDAIGREWHARLGADWGVSRVDRSLWFRPLASAFHR